LLTTRKAVLVGAIASAAALILTSTPALAADNPSQCPSGNLCVWQGPNYTLGAVPGGSKMSQNNTTWGYSSTEHWAIWDNDESWSNMSSSGNSVGVYSLENYYGWVEQCIYPRTWLTSTSSTPSNNKNNGRSNRWKSGAGCYAAGS
jgi:hypothetical protein